MFMDFTVSGVFAWISLTALPWTYFMGRGIYYNKKVRNLSRNNGRTNGDDIMSIAYSWIFHTIFVALVLYLFM